MKTKTCYRCGEEKSIDDFRMNRTKKDNRCSECKFCQVEYRRQLRHRDLERDAAHSRNRRERIKSAEGEMPSIEEVTAFYGNYCLCCGAFGVALQRDHVIPLTLGGSNDMENMQPLCGPCNAAKGNRAIDFRSNKCIAIGTSG